MFNWSISNQTPLADFDYFNRQFFMSGVAEGLIGIAVMAAVGGLALFFIKKLRKAATAK